MRLLGLHRMNVSLGPGGSRLHRIGTVGTSTAKGGLINYLAKVNLTVIDTGETAMGGRWVGKV